MDRNSSLARWARRRTDFLFAARHLPLARATSFEFIAGRTSGALKARRIFLTCEPCARRDGAALILGEPLGLREVVAMALVLGGVTLALQKA